MTAAILIENLKRRGFTLSATDGRLQVEGPAGTVTPALRSQLAENKAEILAVLDPSPPPLIVVCADCRYFNPDEINPADGIGSCAAGRDGLHYPRMKRDCDGFQISRVALDQLASELSTDPDAFAAAVWADGIYTHPLHIRRLAHEIEQRGTPADWSK